MSVVKEEYQELWPKGEKLCDVVVALPLSDVVHSHSVTRLSETGPRASLLRTSWG